jgi:hypothetical protein
MLAPLALVAAQAVAPPLPAPQSLARFPDASYWPGAGLQQVSNMLAEIQRDSEQEMRSHGPGPQQLAARWARGGLSERDQLALLLGGASYHHPSLLPVYAQALRSPSLTVRQAAAVGLAWLLGDRPAAPQSIPDTAETWQRLGAFADALVEASRTRSLVGIWIDSYLHGSGLLRPAGLVLAREPSRCLEAIDEIATPGDLPELLALWPLLPAPRDRYAVLRTLERIMVARLVAAPAGPRRSWGTWVYESGAEIVDTFVAQRCSTVDGWEVARRNAIAVARHDDGCGGCRPEPWLKLLEVSYPPVWALALEVLPAFGAPVVLYQRGQLPGGDKAPSLERVLGYFEVRANAPGGRLQLRVQSPTGPEPAPHHE